MLKSAASGTMMGSPSGARSGTTGFRSAVVITGGSGGCTVSTLHILGKGSCAFPSSLGDVGSGLLACLGGLDCGDGFFVGWPPDCWGSFGCAA